MGTEETRLAPVAVPCSFWVLHPVQSSNQIADFVAAPCPFALVGLQLSEKIETVSPAGRLVFHVFAALAEFERNLIRERTVAGLKAARARGRTGGRPAKLFHKDGKTIRALLKSADISVPEIAARFNIARSTLYWAILKPAA